jgi:hypothetical protein
MTKTSLIVALSLALLSPLAAVAQVRGSVSGIVSDPSNAVVPGADVTLTSQATEVERRFETGPTGSYSFPDVLPGDYTISVTATGFRTAQSEVEVRVNQHVRVDLQLELGATTETVTVSAAAAQLNFENATIQAGVDPDVLLQLPLLTGGGPRRVSDFVLLIPGAATGGTDDAFTTRFNGGMQAGDEALMDGISMIQGTIANNGMVAFEDFAVSPEMVSEVKVLTSNYEPQYGTTNSAIVTATTKSGTSEYHGGGFWYHRNDALDARQFGADTVGKNLENNFGGYLGGPVPFLTKGNNKTFFYYLNEQFRIRGGVGRPTITIPSLKQRQGDFTDWLDGSGNLIPVFDPATTQIDGDGNISRQQFNCQGIPNVICPSRIQNSLANEWLQHLPTPTNNQAVNNYLVDGFPLDSSETNLATGLQMIKIDNHAGEMDHVSFMYRRQRHPDFEPPTELPAIITGREWTPPETLVRDLWRFNWDHTFSPTWLNTFNFGALQWYLADEAVNAPFVDDLPQIAGVAHEVPPGIHFDDGFESMGSGFGFSTGQSNQERMKNFIFTNLTTWIKGSHTIKFGGEFRWLGQSAAPLGEFSGSFFFNRQNTGLLDVNSGSPIASFLLENVADASTFLRSIERIQKRMDAYILHVGDSWRATSKLTVDFGLRWDLHRPSWSEENLNSFFDPTKANPGAGGRNGALAFAGSDHGAASFGKRYPEDLYKKAFSPRFGLAFAVNDKLVVRAGYGIFFSQPFYGGWGGGIATDGLTASPSFSSTLGGLSPAMILSQGFPQNFLSPPFIDPSFANGTDSISYRGFEGNRLSYSQQWNLTIERQLDDDSHFSAAYVANKGTRLPSAIAEINTLHPQYLSLGSRLYDEFEPGQASLHGIPAPYEGWAEQMQSCAPSLAQALLPYPQYCSNLQAVNEMAGNSTYHSLQLKLERRFSSGMFLLGSYTLSKHLTTSNHVHETDLGGTGGRFSPYERHRAKSLSHDDVPQVLSVAFAYELPFGTGKRFRSGNPVVNKLTEGWAVSIIQRASSGLPTIIDSGQCNVPGQLAASCVPALREGANPFLVSKDGYDPGTGSPLLNADSFEPLGVFEGFGYTGAGPRVQNFRLFGYSNTNMSIYKDTRISEKVKFQLRFEMFNLWNQHIFTASGQFGESAFTTDIASPDFGMWNGNVTNPRNIQIGARLEF